MKTTCKVFGLLLAFVFGSGESTAQSYPIKPIRLAVAETGYEFEGITWAGLFAPAGTPRPIIDRLCSAISAVLKSDEMRERFIAAGREPIEGQGMPPAEFEKFFRLELAKWTKAIKDLGIRADH